MNQEVEGVESSGLGDESHPVIFSMEEKSVEDILHEAPVEETSRNNCEIEGKS